MAVGRKVLKNTLFLYLRMLVTVLVSLYTTRVLLSQLGVMDYGLNSAIGGVVAMTSFITGAMSNASTRFFSYALGTGDQASGRRIFQSTVTIYALFILLIVLVAETAGLWFVRTRLTIPAGRETAALWVYQFAILSLVVSFFRVPYNSCIIAHERMDFFAWSSVAEVLLKLGAVFLLVLGRGDRLILYGLLNFGVTALVTAIYVAYCRGRFSECVFRFRFDRKDTGEILGFAGWHFVSSMGDVALDQGINIILNIFFGPAVNAARGLAYSVRSQVRSFVGNFQVAATPQITMYYAAGRKERMQRLLLQTSKFSFFLMAVITVPAFIGADWLLGIWLEEVPDYTVLFVRLLLVNILADSLGGTMNIGINATGRIGAYFLTISLFKLLAVGAVYILFRYYSMPPEYSVICTIAYSLVSIVIKVVIYSRNAGFPAREYVRGVLVPDLLVLAVILGCLWPCWHFLDLSSTVVMLAVMVFGVAVSAVAGYFIGCNAEERTVLRNLVKTRLRHD